MGQNNNGIVYLERRAPVWAHTGRSNTFKAEHNSILN